MPSLYSRTARRLRTPIFVVLAAGALAFPSEPSASIDERRLVFYHTHTNQQLDVVYARNGEYLDSARGKIERFLSDFRTGERTEIDPALLDVLFELRERLGSRGTYEVISAYRSPETNEMLRTSTTGVAKNSQHLVGRAIDVRLRGVSTAKLRDTAIAMRCGGVGYYAQSDFVHLDTGRVRRW